MRLVRVNFTDSEGKVGRARTKKGGERDLDLNFRVSTRRVC